MGNDKSSSGVVISETSASSSEFSDDTGWQTSAAIGGAVGGVTLIGIGAAIVVVKKCSTKRKTTTAIPANSDIELIEDAERASSHSTRRPTFLNPTSLGFTEHPAFIGRRYGHTYEIWKKLSPEEADLVRPLTSIPIPAAGSKKIKFTLGQGQFGVTYVGRNPKTKELYAIKEVHGQQAVEESLREGEIVHSLGEYAHIMPLIDYINFEPEEKHHESRLLQVMPLAYINGTGFKELLAYSSNTNRERIVSDSLRQMMMGLEYIHKNGVVHLDIKADNTLYLQDGTLKIADFGRAQQIGDNDQIADINSLGDIRKFSPEIIAFIRKCKGIPFETSDSFSGKAADVWAAGLYIWELLDDDSDNFSYQRRIPLKTRGTTYTYQAFEKLVETINTLNGNYSSALLNLLRQVLSVDPEKRVKTVQVIRELSSSAMRDHERKAAFEELIRSITNPRMATEEQISIPVYAFAEPDLYIRESDNEELPKVSLQKLEGPYPMSENQQPIAYLPSGFYAKEQQ